MVDKTIFAEAVRKLTDRFAEGENHIGDDDVTRAVNEALERCAERVFRRLQRTRCQRVVEERATRMGFEARLYARWAIALDIYEVVRVIAVEAGDIFNKANRQRAAEEHDVVFDVLARLHARACSVASEVYALMASGHATGALARWRSLHETAVVAYFVSRHGCETAERYLLHEVVESCRAANAYEQCYQALGYTPPDLREHARLQNVKRDLLKRYGKEFGEDYGWAASALKKARPTFSDLERDVDLHHMRAHYRMSSHGGHSNPKSVKFNIGLIGRRDIMLAGPSNAGLADPADCALVSLYQCTAVLLCSRPDEQSLMSLLAMGKFVDRARAAFHRVHREMVAEESTKDDC